MYRALLGVVAVLFLSACDEYIEEAQITPEGSVEFFARATVDCRDDLQQAIWGEDPCERIDTAVRTGDFGTLPLDIELDANRVAVLGSGEQERRVIDASWSGEAEELVSLLVTGGEVQVLDEQRSEVVFSSVGNAFERLLDSADPEIVAELRTSRWEPAQFRVRAPDLITEHNADRIQGRVVVWNIDEDMPSEFRVAWTTEGPARQVWWIVAASVILLGVVVLIITMEGPAQARARRASSSETKTQSTSNADTGAPSSEDQPAGA